MIRTCTRVHKSVYVTFETIPVGTKNSNMHCAHCVEISHFVNVAKCTRDQCSIFSTVQ